MRKIFNIYLLVLVSCVLFCSCNDWLNLLPKNEQVTDDYWKSKEDVEAVVASGYYYMREAASDLILWGELRGASIYAYSKTESINLQNFQLTGSEKISSWSTVYSVINMANSVIAYAPEVQEMDETYTVGAMNAHLSEAYFMRGLMYFYLVRNYKEVPLITIPYIDDSSSFWVEKSDEDVIIAQIKADIKTALESDGAKEFYDDDEWNGASKGRVTKWALYALMAEVCLWSEDYTKCIEYANLLINATATRRPAFMSIAEQWFTLFNPGNSNESIFELNWNSSSFQQTSGSPSNFFTFATTAELQYTTTMKDRLIAENMEALLAGKEPIRGSLGSYVLLGDDIETAIACIWKYTGTEVKDANVTRTTKDANWIIYRMADVMLMKAEALIWKDVTGWQEAIDIVNTIRRRANLDDLDVAIAEMNEEDMLNLLLNERDMEFAAEGKRWYDLVRFGKSKDYKYKNSFITMMVDNNSTANDSWIRSVLQNNYAWYLPIFQDELETNRLLEQNPYYGVTSGKKN